MGPLVFLNTDILKDTMYKKGYTFTQLGKESNVNPRTISRAAHGKAIRYSILESICKTLELNIDVLMIDEPK